MRPSVRHIQPRLFKRFSEKRNDAFSIRTRLFPLQRREQVLAHQQPLASSLLTLFFHRPSRSFVFNNLWVSFADLQNFGFLLPLSGEKRIRHRCESLGVFSSESKGDFRFAPRQSSLRCRPPHLSDRAPVQFQGYLPDAPSVLRFRESVLGNQKARRLAPRAFTESGQGRPSVDN